MPVLSKSRHELFAQAVANGRSLDDAYSDAGFVRNRGNASKLMRNTAIQSRVDDLLQERAKGTLQKTISEVHYIGIRFWAISKRRAGSRSTRRMQRALPQRRWEMARVLGLIIDRREVGEAAHSTT
jgi:hypothetical protein